MVNVMHAYCVVLLVAKEVTFGSKIEAGFSINNGPWKRVYNADFCRTISEVNFTCPLQPGRLWLVYPLLIQLCS